MDRTSISCLLLVVHYGPTVFRSHFLWSTILFRRPMHDRMVADDSNHDRMVVGGSREISGHVACDEMRSNGPEMSRSRSDDLEACSDDNRSAYPIRTQI